MTDDITKELAETLRELRTKFDSRENLTWTMVEVDAILDRYDDACKQMPSGDAMAIVDDILERYAEPFMNPEPIITRVEVITDNGREYVSWNKDNVITTSLQDDGKTLKIFVTTNTNTEEPKMTITKPPFYYNLTPGDKTLYTVAEDEVSKQWATALSGLVDNLGGDKPALWEWEGKTPTPEKVVEYLRENIKYLQQLAADEELERCIEWVSIELNCTDQEHLVPYLREYRRPKPTLKSQALKDFETVRKHSDLLPEILDTIENALKSIPENV